MPLDKSPQIPTVGVTKHAGGRPKGSGKLQRAVKAASQITEEIAQMDAVVSEMSENQRRTFEAILSGDDELTIALKSGNEKWFTGIVRNVYMDSGEKVSAKKITLMNKDDLSRESYTYLNRVCASQVRDVVKMDDYRKYLEPIREYIKRLSPLALGTIVQIAQSGEKEENRLKAAKDLLDRAGEREPEPENNVVVPIQVLINLTQSDGSIIEYNRNS